MAFHRVLLPLLLSNSLKQQSSRWPILSKLSQWQGNGRYSSQAAPEEAEEERLFKLVQLPEREMSPREERLLTVATKLIQTLRDDGHLAFIAGGWVRDRFMGRPGIDIDINTNARPGEVKELFPQATMWPRNCVKVMLEGEGFEVTSFRGYSREPDELSAYIDACLRDFTINSLFYDPISGWVLDAVGGVDDICNEVLRANKPPVGYAQQHSVLREDPVRLMRAVRFCVTHRFTLDPATEDEIINHAKYCSYEKGLSAPRLLKEWRKIAAECDTKPGPSEVPYVPYRLAPTSESVSPDIQGGDAWWEGVYLANRTCLLSYCFPFIKESTMAAVRAAARLSKLPRIRGDAVMPLELRIAALVKPVPSSQGAYEEMRSNLFKAEVEVSECFGTLIEGVRLNAEESGVTDSSAWRKFYLQEHAGSVLDIIAAWMPSMPSIMVENFISSHRQALHEAQPSKEVTPQS